MRLLLVEDDPMIGESVEEGLRGENYAVDWVRDGRSAELALANGVYDVILLDLGLPRKQGLDVLVEYRRAGGDAPVLILTARDATVDRVGGSMPVPMTTWSSLSIWTNCSPASEHSHAAAPAAPSPTSCSGI